MIDFVTVDDFEELRRFWIFVAGMPLALIALDPGRGIRGRNGTVRSRRRHTHRQRHDPRAGEHAEQTSPRHAPDARQ
jgi:hypothetical protein